MTDSPMIGRVVIVAGSGGVFAAVAAALVADDALVAVLSTDSEGPEVAAHFRGDPADPGVWGRMVPHVEQRLGPIDAVVTDASGRALADELVAPDLIRRGHGAIVTVEETTQAADVLTTLVDTL